MPDNLDNLVPITPEENIFAYISGGTKNHALDYAFTSPRTRKEWFLSQIGGMTSELRQTLYSYVEPNVKKLYDSYPIPAQGDAGKTLIVEETEDGARFVFTEGSDIPPAPSTGELHLISDNGTILWASMPPNPFFVAEFSQGFYSDLGSIITSTVSGLLAGTSTSNVLSTDYDPRDDADYDVATWEDMLAAFSDVPGVYIFDALNNQALRLTLDNVSSPNDPAVVASFPVLSPAVAVYVRVSFIVRYMPPDPSDPSDYPEFRMICIAERIYPGITPTT